MEFEYELIGEDLPFDLTVETEVLSGDGSDFVLEGEGGLLLNSLGVHGGLSLLALADGLIEGDEEVELGIGRITPLTSGFLDPLSAIEVGGSVRVRIVDGDAAEVRLSLETAGQAAVGQGSGLRVIEGTRGILTAYLFPEGGILGEEQEVRVVQGGMELPRFILGSGTMRMSLGVVLTEDTEFSFVSGQGSLPGVEFGVGVIRVFLVEARVSVRLRVDSVLVQEGGVLGIEVLAERDAVTTPYPVGEVVVRGLTAEEGSDFFPLTGGEFSFESAMAGEMTALERFEVRLIEDEVREDVETLEIYLSLLGFERFVRVEGDVESPILVRIEDDDEEEEEEVTRGGGGGGIGPLFLLLGFLGAVYRLCWRIRSIE